MTAKKNSHITSKSFVIRLDHEVFKGSMMPSLPLIEMEFDNDCES